MAWHFLMFTTYLATVLTLTDQGVMLEYTWRGRSRWLEATQISFQNFMELFKCLYRLLLPLDVWGSYTALDEVSFIIFLYGYLLYIKKKLLKERLARDFSEKYQPPSVHNEMGLILFLFYRFFLLSTIVERRSCMRWKPRVWFWNRDYLNRRNGCNRCWLSPMS